MENNVFRRLSICVVATISLATVGCGTADTAGRDRVIEAALNEIFGVLEIPIGPQLRLSPTGLEYLKKAEAAGLVEIREIPQGYWDSFLTRTQGMGTPFEVVRTAKLIDIALNPNLGGEAGDDPNYTETVRVSEAKMDKVLTDEEYKGQLATPGEKYRLILGTFKNTPTAAAAVVGPGLATAPVARFRCVVKYSELKKEWSVTALDVGSTDPERWYTANVK